MAALDFALGLRMMRRAADVIHALIGEPVRESTGDVGRAVVAEKPGLVSDRRVIASRCLQGQREGIGHVVGPHGRTELPGDDVARVVVQDRRQIEPAPADDLEVGEVGLPQLVRRRGLVLEGIRRLDDNKGRAGDQIMGLQKPIRADVRQSAPFADTSPKLSIA